MPSASSSIRSSWTELDGSVDDLVLTDLGRSYAAALARFLKERYPPEGESLDDAAGSTSSTGARPPRCELEVWTSMLRRSIEMAEFLSPVSLFLWIAQDYHFHYAPPRSR